MWQIKQCQLKIIEDEDWLISAYASQVALQCTAVLTRNPNFVIPISYLLNEKERSIE